MRDWEALVRREIGGLALDDEEQSEVFAELAAHLEEAYQTNLRPDLTEEEAEKRALMEAGDWRQLRRKIQTAKRKEGTMTDRVKQFWLPSLLTFFLAMALLALLQLFGPNPVIIRPHAWRRIAPATVIYIPWLLSLLPVGALGAYLAGRAGATQRVLLLSSVFPILPYLLLFLIAFPVSLILDDHVAHNIMYQAWLTVLLAWVVFPGIALLAGGLPLQIIQSRRAASRQVTA